MTPDIQTRLAHFVGATLGDTYVSSCATEAKALVSHLVGEKEVPAEVLERAVIEVGADLYHRRSARNGIAGFEDSDMGASPIRISRDPLAAARPILQPFLGVPIA